RKIAFAIVFPIAQQHLAKSRDVLGTGEKAARGHGETGLTVVERILELADGRLLEIRFVLVALVRFGDTHDLSGIGPEGRVLHPERLEEALIEKILILLPADHL